MHENNHSIKEKIILTIVFLGVLFLATYKLTESPPTWMDEGLIIQPVKNLVESGVYEVQIAPDHFVSPSFISTSYPVTFPIALSFKLFGVGLLQARAVMVLYILLFISVVFLLCKYCLRETWAILHCYS